MNFLSNLSMIKKGFKIMYKIEKTYLFLIIFSSVFAPLSVYLNIYLFSKLIDELNTFKNYKSVIILVISVLLADSLIAILISLFDKMKTYHMDLFYKNESMYFAEKTMSLDYESIEDRNVYLLYEKVKQESRTGANAFYFFQSINILITNFINIILSIIFTYTLFLVKISVYYKIIMLIIIFAVVFISLLTTKKQNILLHEANNKRIPLNSIYNFYGDYFDDYNTGKDIRIYGMQNLLMNKLDKINKDIGNIKIWLFLKRLKYFILKSVSTDLLTFSSYIYVIYICIIGMVTLGNITKYVSCAIIFVSSCTAILTGIQSLLNNNKYLKNYINYLEIPSKMTDGNLHVGEINCESEIQFNHVSFKYPNSDQYVLKDCSIKIKLNKTFAIVGMNGSGKTTFIKLLTRMYDPTEGNILLNGIDIRQFIYREYLDIFSVTFQDFKIFDYTLSENISCTENIDENKAVAYIKQVSFWDRYIKMGKGLKTYLYKGFNDDGIEISGGEAQKIAIARALYKDSKIFIMDEPTSALDPISEYELYSKLNEIIQNRIAIFVSHRMSSCKFSDYIIVFHDGSIIQSGIHSDLLNELDGKYYELWSAQKQYYE
jgi:ATP-binding cassette subfamily B protein